MSRSVRVAPRAARLAFVALSLVACSRDSGTSAPALNSTPRPAAASTGTATTTKAVDVAAGTFSEPEPVQGNAAQGKALVEQFECARCHAGTQTKTPELPFDCTGCHQKILAGTFPAPKDKLAEWTPHLRYVRAVPSFTGIGDRVSAAFIRDYLLHPRDLRPNLKSTMPRFPLSKQQASHIAAYLSSLASSKPPPVPTMKPAAAIARGRQLVLTRGCLACHRFSGLEGAPKFVEPSDPSDTQLLAPDLAQISSRGKNLTHFLHSPTSVKADTTMPALGLTLEEASQIADFLRFGVKIVAASTEPFRMPRRLPVLTREVRYSEVEQKVFGKTCRHCHGNPELGMGDGGPGNTGGLGFKGIGLSFASYRDMTRGYRNSRGEPVSLFKADANGVPRIINSLMMRHAEVAFEQGTAKDTDGSVRGMPLGLPALSLEEIQLVETWIAQGRKQ